MSDDENTEFQIMPSGIPNLDIVLGGGVPDGENLLITGPSGTGKTTLSMHFLMEGVRNGEPGVMVAFEETPEEHLRKARTFGWDLTSLVRQNQIELIYMRPFDLTVEETLQRIERAIDRIGARRVVINSISGFELAIAPTEREDFREALYRLSRGLTGRGIGVLMTTEVPEAFGDMSFTFHRVSFLTDNIVMTRYVEIESALLLAITVVKMRTSKHSRELREYSITDKGIEIGPPFDDYSAVMSGIAVPNAGFVLGGLRMADDEKKVLQALFQIGESTADQVATQAGLDVRLVEEILPSLSRRRYVAQITESGRVTYRAVLPELQALRTRQIRGSSRQTPEA